MSIRDIISKAYIPYRAVVYVSGFVGLALMMVASFLPPSFFFLKYIGIASALAGLLYMYFWVYKAGYKKEALLMAIVSTAFAIIIIVALVYYFNLLYGV